MKRNGTQRTTNHRYIVCTVVGKGHTCDEVTSNSKTIISIVKFNCKLGCYHQLYSQSEKNEIRRVWDHFKDIFGFGYALWRIFEVTFMIQYYGARCGYNTASNVGIATHGEKEGV